MHEEHDFLIGDEVQLMSWISVPSPTGLLGAAPDERGMLIKHVTAPSRDQPKIL